MTPTEREYDKAFLNWIYERMICVHGEKDLYDYMINFKAIIDRVGSEHDKARNQAINEAINWLKSEIENEDYVQGDNYDKHSYGRACAFNDAIEHLESLKTIS